MAITNGYASNAAFDTLLGINTATHSDDIDRAITTASRWIDAWTKRRFYADDTAAARYYTPDDPLDLPVYDISTTTGLIVKTDDNLDGTYENTWTIDSPNATRGFYLEPNNASELDVPWTRLSSYGASWPVGIPKGVQITAKWGWASCPTEIEQACLLLASRIYSRKDAAFGMAGSQQIGYERLPALDPDAKMLIAPFKRYELVDA